MSSPSSTAGAGSRSNGTPEYLLLAAIWGASFLFMKIGAAEFGALPTAALRVGIAALFLLPILHWRGQTALLMRHWKALLVIGVLNSGLPFALYSFAMLSITTSLGAVINATVPMFGALVAWVWLSDRLNRSQALGLLLGFAGVALLALSRGGIEGPASGHSGLLAVLACVGACISYGFGANAARRYLGDAPALVSATGSQVGASIALALPAALSWPAQTPSPHAWGALVAVGVLCTGVAYILFFRLIARAGATRALTVTYVIPLFAVAYGVLLLGEQVTWWMVGCGLVIVLGTALATGRLRLGSA